ncbi:MAG TPA: ATP-dependent protease LonB, partial [Clostridiaceae bacterium]|nr:ATP-dependent protease LonB [Clostridiaceae bacterium]
EWVIEFGHYSPRIDKKACATEQIGCMNGLAVLGSSTGMIIDIEVSAIRAKSEKGIIKITGIVEEEEIDGRGHKIKMISSAKASVENALTVLRRYLDVDCREYDIHLNFPGGVPIDGPSAGIAIAVALYSAILNIPVNGDLAMTGELSIRGKVKPVGGVTIKLETAKQAGIKKVIIPKENWQELYNDMGISVIPVDNIGEVLDITFNRKVSNLNDIIIKNSPTNIISATS